MTIQTIYVVQGATGEYSDHLEWPVRAFLSEEKAKAHVVALAAWCDEHQCGENAPGTYEARDAARDKGHPLDPRFRCDYTGTRYEYFPVECES